MPIYEYRCKQCNHTFEDLVQANQTNRSVVCPECENHDVMRLLSVFGVGTSDIASVPTADMPTCGTCGHQTPQPCSQAEI
jgi:putative FmdB family regulatory protein